MINALVYRLENVHDPDRTIAGVLGVCVLLAILGYVYLINDSIFHVAARKEAEERVATIETDITALVSDYMAISATITLERARALGFVEVEDQAHFASRNTDTALTLSLKQ